MVFNSWQFLVFLIIVLALDGLLQNRATARKWMLLIASYLFYGAWSWMYLALIMASTVIDFEIGKRLPKSTSPRQLMLFSVVSNLGILAFFKYTNFVITSLNYGFSAAHSALQFTTLDILLPVGISFFTFQALSYTIDVYRKEIAPRESLLDYALFIAFFPQLVAGPIVRAVEFFKELDAPKPPNLREINLGLVLIILGLVKKMAVADSLSVVVDPVFNAPLSATPVDSLLAVYSYALQIYCDFSGYTDTAIGCALLFGFRFPDNFNYPYIATSFQEFWRRWHMTLSRFLRDYLYIALGGNRLTPTRTQVNLMLTMVLGGLWHGASWTFVFWGLLHGSYLVAERAAQALAPRFYASRHPMVLLVRWALVFHAVCFAWIFFRAKSFADALVIIKSCAGLVVSNAAPLSTATSFVVTPLMSFLALFALVHFTGNRFHTKQRLSDAPAWICGTALGVALCVLCVYTPAEHKAFIYFQF
jgi:alginate O-acetyltransferase complex protein AlgI